MVQRLAEERLMHLANAFKAVAVIGPKHGDKTTLVRTLFADKSYVSLENPDTLRFSTDDPRGFLDSYPDGAILDEAHRAPHLFSYLQQRLDESREVSTSSPAPTIFSHSSPLHNHWLGASDT